MTCSTSARLMSDAATQNRTSLPMSKNITSAPLENLLYSSLDRADQEFELNMKTLRPVSLEIILKPDESMENIGSDSEDCCNGFPHFLRLEPLLTSMDWRSMGSPS